METQQQISRSNLQINHLTSLPCPCVAVALDYRTLLVACSKTSHVPSAKETRRAIAFHQCHVSNPRPTKTSPFARRPKSAAALQRHPQQSVTTLPMKQITPGLRKTSSQNDTKNGRAIDLLFFTTVLALCVNEKSSITKTWSTPPPPRRRCLCCF